MAQTYQVVGYGAERGADPIIDTTVEDVTNEGPEFYAFKALHADGVVCCAIWEAGKNDPPVLVKCDPGVDLHDVVIVVG